MKKGFTLIEFMIVGVIITMIITIIIAEISKTPRSPSNAYQPATSSTNGSTEKQEIIILNGNKYQLIE